MAIQEDLKLCKGVFGLLSERLPEALLGGSHVHYRRLKVRIDLPVFVMEEFTKRLMLPSWAPALKVLRAETRRLPKITESFTLALSWSDVRSSA